MSATRTAAAQATRPSTSGQPGARERLPRWRLTAIVVAGLLLALTLFAVGFQLTFPSDGLELLVTQKGWPAYGVPVARVVGSPPLPLRHGDVVIAAAGRSINAWAADIFAPGATRPDLHLGERLTYTVVHNGHAAPLTVTLIRYPIVPVLQVIWGPTTFVLVFALVAFYIFVRRPRERLTSPLLVAAVALCCVQIGSFTVGVTSLLDGTAWWLFALTTIGIDGLFLAALLHTVLLFPQPHPLTRRWRWLIPTLYVVPFAAITLYLTCTRLLTAPSTIAWLGTWYSAETGLSLAFEALAAGVIVWTYRTSRDEVTRQKIRWVVFGGAVALLGTVLLYFIPLIVLGQKVIDTNLLGLVQLAFPVCLAIAILRYRLFDIDTVINRTMVYGTLTVVLAAVYFVSVVTMEALARALTGQSKPHPLIIVLSTLAIAALIQPLRRRIQDAIDRRFYRHKYDAAKTLAAFGATLRYEVDLPGLSDQLVGVVDEAMRPAFISLWLRPHPAPGAVATSSGAAHPADADVAPSRPEDGAIDETARPG